MHAVVLVALALKLVWSDEFNGPANTPPDLTKWTYDLGGGGWGNDELEIYTQSAAYQDGAGNLVIHVAQNSDGSYTSARMKTQGLFNTKYGRIEARIKIPYGQGIWPAFWMLGDNIDLVDWPDCGEIDIMENIGKEPGMIHGTVHGPGYEGDSPFTAAYTLPGGVPFSDDYHVYAISWTPDSITFFVDEHAYYRTSVRELPGGTNWVFNHPFFLLLNVAVGGSWPGDPDQTSTFPQNMLVDYVRVYAIQPEL
jgi:beta-glucanase (GH16 family)